MTATIFVLNGPNLNLLGQREPHIYGSDTLEDIEGRLQNLAQTLELAVDFRQSNHEGVLVDWIQDARLNAQGIIINPAGYGHTSVAILDALLASGIPVVEVHLSNIHKREPFRHHSYVSSAARSIVMGFGAIGYELALQGLARLVGPGRA
ncbi:type II 3-dehydroquinate dehydratase [Terrihabitans sp. B22-R8]|uniref:type II 3-dehydroquinate dehydratase n=1 Tax=Terrihabitans sp. B22-R8 TaxID=3425128 RepID=UPI00403CE1DB